ncbi:MAG: hypothetical protein ACFE0I_04015 [Elainellaceae cyanobacterium]
MLTLTTYRTAASDRHFIVTYCVSWNESGDSGGTFKPSRITSH